MRRSRFWPIPHSKALGPVSSNGPFRDFVFHPRPTLGSFFSGDLVELPRMTRTHSKICWLVSVAGALWASCVPAWAADGVVAPVTARAGVLNLRAGDVVVTDHPDLRAGGWPAGQRVVVVIDGAMTAARRAELNAAGIRHLGYLPSNAFLADLDAANPDHVRKMGWITRVIAYDKAWKLAPELTEPMRNWTEPERIALSAAGRRMVSVWLFKGDTETQLRAWCAEVGGVVHSSEMVSGGSCVSVEVRSESIAALAELTSVQWVEEFPEFGLRSNTTVRWMVQSATNGFTPLYSRGLTGGGQILGLVDGRLGVNHCSFNDPEADPVGPLHRKILAYNTTVGYELHGTHVGGTAVGDGGAFNNTRGVAYDAQLVYNYYPSTTETAVFDRFDLHATQGARVHNNSWGRIDGFNGYDGPTRAIDSFLFESDDNLIVFAVANATFISNPENAKNTLAVGAVQLSPNENLPYSSSSMGPTLDGRRKPEVMTPGASIVSSGGSSGCGTVSQNGTSMAAPSVSGVGMLIRQYFMSGYFPTGQSVETDAFIPSGSLLKSMIVNSAVDVTGIAGFPSTREGWGRVIADNSVFFFGDGRKLLLRDVRNDDRRAICTGLVHELSFTARENDHLKVTLSWFDAPAIAGVTYTPVNDLDLEVESPSGVIFKGNVFNAGVSETGGSFDRLNNLEQILVAAPEEGSWIVRVRGEAINEQTQGYALVVTGDVQGQPCIGDFDFSGSADSDDIVCFFSAWDVGEGIADVNRSGGVDSDDVIVFFESWDSGC